jgi:cytochrome c biogenesis protein CcmG/thiol:disulfide interchange protein DsbE
MTDLTSQTTPELVESKPRRLSVGVIIAFALIIGLLAILGWRLVKVNSGQVSSGKAPDFTITSFEGETITLSELRGQVVIINFWASWCPPCREEAPYLEATWRKYKDQGVIFIGVDYVDTESKALAYIDEFDITYFNGPDVGTRISHDYNMQGVPETFYVSKNGDLHGLKVGPLFPPELDEVIDELLAEPYNGE